MVWDVSWSGFENQGEGQALIMDHARTIEEDLEDFFFEDLPEGEKIYYHLENITRTYLLS